MAAYTYAGKTLEQVMNEDKALRLVYSTMDGIFMMYDEDTGDRFNLVFDTGEKVENIFQHTIIRRQ